MRFLWILTALAALSLSGCGDVAKPEMSLDSLRGLKLTSVDVTFSPDARVTLPDPSDKMQANAQEKPGAGAADALASERARAAGVLKTVFLREVGARMQGGRPVTARVLVKGVIVPSSGASVVVGVGSAMTASVDLVDASTGQVVASRPEFTALGGDGGGLIAGGIVGAVMAASAESRANSLAGGKMEMLAVKFSKHYVAWLFPA